MSYRITDDDKIIVKTDFAYVCVDRFFDLVCLIFLIEIYISGKGTLKQVVSIGVILSLVFFFAERFHIYSTLIFDSTGIRRKFLFFEQYFVWNELVTKRIERAVTETNTFVIFSTKDIECSEKHSPRLKWGFFNIINTMYVTLSGLEEEKEELRRRRLGVLNFFIAAPLTVDATVFEKKLEEWGLDLPRYSFGKKVEKRKQSFPAWMEEDE